MQKTIFTIFICFLAYSSNLLANDLKVTIKEAIEKSADQQVISQQVAKVYVALCNNLMEPKFYQERDASIEAFDEQLHQLSLFTPTDKVKENIQNVRAIWKEYKEIAGWSIKKDAASKLIKQSTSLLQACKSLTAAYKEFEKSQLQAEQNSDLITIKQYIKQNNNQLILTQRVMLYYLAEKQGIDATASGHKLDEAAKAFASILDILQKAKITSKSIQKKLDYIKKQWSGISMHLVFVDKDQSYVDDMLNRADNISKAVREVSQKYEELSIKLAISYSINEATSQSMLTQKIAKSYIASHNDNLAYKYKKEVVEHVAEFEKKMEAMLITAPNEDLQRSINVVKIMWKNYKNLVTDFNNMDEIRVIKVLEQCHVVMAACDRVADDVEDYAQEIPSYRALQFKDGHDIDPSLDITHQIQISSHLRVYSQRVALYFMMTVLELDSHLSNERLKGCISEFAPKFDELKSSRLNSVAMNKLLESCLTEWDWITEACERKDKGDFAKMLEQSDLLSRKLMKLTNLYEHRMNDLFAEDIDEESPAAKN